MIGHIPERGTPCQSSVIKLYKVMQKKATAQP